MLLLSAFIYVSSISGVLSFNRPCFVSPRHLSVSSVTSKLSFLHGPTRRRDLQRMFLSSDGGSDDDDQQPPTITNIDKAEMTEIISHVDNGTGDKNYVVIDVRGEPEIMMGTGTMSEKVHILPLPQITMMGAFDMDDKSFEAQFNFPKPSAEEDTLVFTCKMGGRSQQAAQLAAMSGYKKIINYTGGADDWFGGEFVYT
jgi:rhodanese-related sulfurtransferase